MGSFIGHIDEGVVFLVLGYWWMINMFRDYRQTLRTGEPYKSRVSYVSKIGKRSLPLEIYLKIFFTAAAFFGEIFAHGLPVSFVHDDNRFYRLQNLQHMTIYGLFFIHGVVDLLSYHKVSPFMSQMKYITGVVAFFWYGSQFYYHSAESTHKSPLEDMLHRLPISTILLMPIMFIWEMRQRQVITPQLIRCLGMLIMGTWFTHVSFILYVPFPSESSSQNTAWDRTDLRNVHFATSLYGFHIIFNILVMLLVYALVSVHGHLLRVAKRVFRIKTSGHEYHKINNVGDPTDVKEYHDLVEDNQLFV